MVGIEDRMREERRGALERGWNRFGSRFDSRGAEDFQEVRDVAGRFVEGNGERFFVEQPEVDSTSRGAGGECGGVLTFWGDADRVKERSVVHGVAGFFQGGGKQCRVAVDAGSDFTQAFWAMINGIHRGHHGQKHLSGADVARRLIAADVLLAGLESEAQSGIAGSVLRNTHETARETALVFIARSKECGMGSTESRSDTKPLARSNHDIRTAFAGRLEKGDGQEIRSHNGQRAGGVSARGDFFEITDGSVRAGVLE